MAEFEISDIGRRQPRLGGARPAPVEARLLCRGALPLEVLTINGGLI
jgi:hypothetical protein